MPDFRIDVDIQAPPARVWAILSDIERWPQWTSTVTSIQRLDPGPLSIGSQARVHQPKLPPALWRVNWLDEAAHTFAWVTHSPGVAVTARHWVESRAGGSRASLTLHFEGFLGPLVARLTRGLNRRYLEIEAKGLTERSEAAA